MSVWDTRRRAMHAALVQVPPLKTPTQPPPKAVRRK